MTAEKPTVLRDGTVTLAGQIIGYVRGEPRNWSFILADSRESRRTPGTGWHDKQEAARMCASAWLETRPASPCHCCEGTGRHESECGGSHFCQLCTGTGDAAVSPDKPEES